MKNQRFLIILNLLLFISFLLSLLSGLALWLGLPAWMADLVAFNRRNFRDVHLYASLIFSALAFIHLLMHVAWIKAMPRLWQEK